ncbi:MAG: NADP-dependent malic enzyme [Bacteroides sp.]|nr:MAG: NADP-dependent malic enzyme [Bacteroides sp.]
MKKKALDYHSLPYPGKISVISSKPTFNQEQLSLAYSPGVAEPCLKIFKNVNDIYKYTSKGNLVAVISNGTAVLGLGNIGAEASKPVMEGKAVLFKIFADIDVFDIEINISDVDNFVKIVKSLEPTFGGINLEDIKAPECFIIEKKLKQILKIPVMHDDQHGTAIISGAALINALEIQNKNINKIKMIISGAGSAAISCAKIYISLGVLKENIIMFDSKGVIDYKRNDLDSIKYEFITNRNVKNLREAINGSDVFIGLSKGNIIDIDMLKSMNNNPIIFAMANPDPEIDYNLALKARNDIIIATGRSDFPNQVNNVLGFPYIFRGALDVRAVSINEEMKIAAVHAIAKLAKRPVPEYVNLAYNTKNIYFGKNYIIPKPIDHRLLINVSLAVAKQAVESNIAKNIISDWDQYKYELSNKTQKSNIYINNIAKNHKNKFKKIIFTNASNYKILKAVEIIKDDKIGDPVLLGDMHTIINIINEYKLKIKYDSIIDINDKQIKKLIKHNFIDNELEDYNLYSNLMLKLNLADTAILYFDNVNNINNYFDNNKNISKIYNNHFVVTKCILTKKGPFFITNIKSESNDNIIEVIELINKYINNFVSDIKTLLISNNFNYAQNNNIKCKFDNIYDNILSNMLFEYKFNDDINSIISINDNNYSSKISQFLINIEKYNVLGPTILQPLNPIQTININSSVEDIIQTAIISNINLS